VGGVLVAAGLVTIVTRAKPSYDSMGWMVWGRQVLHWNLNTDGAPSWKPLAFLFTLPYALTGHRLQLTLWTLTAIGSGLAAALLAGRIAYRLTPPAPERRWAPIVGAIVATLGVLSMGGYVHLMLITNSDPLILALLLGAIDCHLSRRHRLAFALIWLAGLGRPEIWAFELLYGLWCWRAVPAMRPLVIVGVLATPLCWFSVPGLTSKSWFTPGDLALGQKTAIHGNKIVGVFNRLRGLTGVPLQIAVAVSLMLAAWRRDRVALGLAATALVWFVVEVAFALHGWSAVARYLIEPGAVLLIGVGIGVGTVLAHAPPASRLERWIGPVAVLALLVSLIPFARNTTRFDHGLVSQAHFDATRIDRLGDVVAADGGARAIRRCGQPVGLLAYQSTLAWELDMNVGSVGYKPGAAIDSGQPIVFFKPQGEGWIVHATHSAPATAARCANLDRRFDVG
jgi:hypothetical protein